MFSQSLDRSIRRIYLLEFVDVGDHVINGDERLSTDSSCSLEEFYDSATAMGEFVNTFVCRNRFVVLCSLESSSKFFGHYRCFSF